MINCYVCNKPFVTGDNMECLLRSPDRPDGIWTQVIVDSEFQNRCAKNGGKSKLKRKHVNCTELCK